MDHEQNHVISRNSRFCQYLSVIMQFVAINIVICIRNVWLSTLVYYRLVENYHF